nr:restriction endonuclease subunit S [uncultured Prevotella sp.]
MREGWEYKKFENCIVKSPKLKQVKKEAYNNGSQYPIISQEEKFISGYCDDESMVCHIDRPVVVFGDHTRVLKYIDFDFVVGADGVKVIIPIKSIDSKFLLYFLQWYNIPNLGYSRHYKLLKDVMVPIPNCTTQLSIVSELDKLNELIQIKKEQLKDYDALAQSIFYEMFGDPVENEKGWEVKKLGEVSIYPKERIVIDQICPNQYIGVENLIKDRGGVRFSDNLPKADVAIAYKENDILLGNIRPYLKKIWLADKVGGASGDVVIIRIKERLISPLFLFKLLSSDQFFEYDNNHTKGAKMPRGDRKTIAKFGVILPPLSLQQSFAQKIEQIEQQKAAIQKTITDLETLLAARMQYWFD